jgi:hypothetical protein
MRFDPTARLDLHQRFLDICARELARHAAHVRFIRALRLPHPARLWTCLGVPERLLRARGRAAVPAVPSNAAEAGHEQHDG